MKFKILLLSLLGYFNIYADTHILVSTNPSAELNTLIPNTQNIFSPNQVFSSLAEAHSYIFNTYGETISENVTIHIREGNYGQGTLTWKATSYIFTTKIINYNKEKVVIDGAIGLPTGQISGQFLQLKSKYERTNFWIEGLIVQNYVNGIKLGTSTSPTSPTQNSHNTIKNNIFRNIGNKFSQQNTQVGYSVLGLNSSTNNLIESNIFYKIENNKHVIIDSVNTYTKNSIHSIYLAHRSSQNTIKNNYVYLSNAPFRIRNASDNNTFDNNYMDQSGNTGYISEWYGSSEEISNGTVIKNNTCTFPYPSNNEGTLLFSSFLNSGANSNNYTDGGGNFVINTKPICEEIIATTSGDINGDGIDEIFVAFNYGNFTKLVRSNPDTPLYLSKVLYTSKYWHVGAMEMNDFDNNGVPELITAFNALTNNGDNTQIFKGNGINSVSNHGNLYANSLWRTQSMTSGDYDGNGTAEIFVAFNAPDDSSEGDNTQIFKGTGIGNNPLQNLGQVYNNNWWKTQSLTSGDFDGNGTAEIFIAFNAPNGTGDDNTQIFKGTGIDSNPILNLGQVYNHSWWRTQSMTSGDFDGNGTDEIFVAYNAPDNSGDDNTQIFKGTGIGNNPILNLGQIYNHHWWRTGNIISGNFIQDNNSRSEVSMFYSASSTTQMFFRNGLSFNNYGQYYRSENLVSCIQNLSSYNLNIKTNNLNIKNDIPSIYPNPIDNSNILKIQGVNGDFEVIIYSNTGRILKSIKNKNQIVLNSFISGLYYVKIINSEGVTTKKLIIK